jgi:hypothetical protein
LTDYCIVAANDIAEALLSTSPYASGVRRVFDSNRNKSGRKIGNNFEISYLDQEGVKPFENCEFVICSPGSFKDILSALASFGISSGRIWGYSDLTGRLVPSKDIVDIKRSHLVTAFLPKSGTEWISHVLRKSMWSGGSRVRGGKWGLDEGSLEISVVEQVMREGGLCGSHIHPGGQNLEILKYYQPNVLIHVRDPRQALVSAVHFFNSNKQFLHNELLLKINGLPKNYFDLPVDKQIDFLIPTFFRYALDWISKWEQVMDQSILDNVIFLKYENFIANETSYFQDVFDLVGLNCTYEKTSPKANERNFRSGSKDEWKQTLKSHHFDLIKKECAGIHINCYDM